MKKLICIALVSIFVSACGSGGSTAPSSSPSGDVSASLPDIIDQISDGIFKYADPSLYRGTYYKASNPTDTCSSDGGVMPATIEIAAMTNGSMVMIYDEFQETLGSIPQTEFDFYVFEGLYSGYSCLYAMSSMNRSGTIDKAVAYCEDADSTLSCAVGYERASAYDFTTTTIKGDPTNAFKSLEDF